MVSLEKQKDLQSKMIQLGIRESDIKEQFVRSSGPGGQNVNKVSTCVYLKHLPTGIEVKCQETRNQALNRFLARRNLLSKIESFTLGKQSQAQRRIEKIRRQKRKRSKRAKEKVLAQKHKRGAIKDARQKVFFGE
jgi:protein subunit release factor B